MTESSLSIDAAPAEHGVGEGRPPGVFDTLREIGRDFHPRVLPLTLAGGLASGVVGMAIAISFAALVFTGPLEQDLPLGMGLALLGTSVLAVFVAFRSAFATSVASVQDNTSAILGVAISAAMVRVAGPDTLSTAVAMIVVSSATLGGLLYLVGRLRLGSLVRYMPFPVVGGFLAATGLILVEGGADLLMADYSLSELAEPFALLLWVPGLALGIAFYLSGRLRPGTLLSPVILLVGAVLLRVGFMVGGVSQDEAMARGWLFGPFPGDVTWSPSTLGLLGEADWLAVASGWVPMLSIAVVGVISLLLYVHAFERESSTEVDINRELRVAGVASLAAGAVGGFPGYKSFSRSAIVQRISGPRRGAALLAAALPASLLLVGSVILGLMPRAVIGGVVLSLGIAFVVEWLWDTRKTLAPVDHALVAVIALATVVAGFLAAIAVGVIIAIGLFVVRYSRVDAVRRTYSLRTSSTLERSREQRRVLDENADLARIVEVRGFLFFGTATNLFSEDRLLAAPGERQPRYVVFDLESVSGLDSSMSMAFPRLDRAAERLGVSLLFAGVPESLRGQVDMAIDGHKAELMLVADRDAALQWCEDRILDDVLGSHEAPDAALFEDLLVEMLGSEGADAVLRHSQSLTLSQGEALLRAGEPSKGLYFLESGRLRAELTQAGRPPQLLRQMLPGTLVGEVGLYRRDVASADVIADTDCVLRVLTLEQVEALDGTDPAAAAALHHFAAAVLAERVLHAERERRHTG